VGTALRKTASQEDLVCRYGGEEFCVLMPSTELDAARRIAEALRAAVAAIGDLPTAVTGSIGVSAIGHGADEPHLLLDQADKALYVSKRSGRNRVTSWLELSADQKSGAAKPEKDSTPREAAGDVPIPFHAVAALSAALSYRDALTAEHSRRVADLCVLISHGLMSERDLYVLEVAALLHDIGKLGVPDSILLKPGPLTDDEWDVMSAHDRIGVEIVRTAFSSKELSEIIGCHHMRFDGATPRDAASNRPVLAGNDIPLRARILTIADAYDAMVSDRVYRQGRTREQAFAELRSCAGKQFDPELVERLIQVVTADDQGRTELSSAVTKQAALRIGLQIERLAEALDARDFSNLSAMAGRMAATATLDGVPEIAELAAALQETSTDDADIQEVVRLTSELLELCRATQSAHLNVAR
jgi:putative nucleotidyltransferase with HDIG domain